MLIHVHFLWNHIDILLAAVILVIIIKTIVVAAVVKGFGYNNKTSLLVRIYKLLAQLLCLCSLIIDFYVDRGTLVIPYLQVGMSLAQIGEFAFVLLSRASNLHLVEVNLNLVRMVLIGCLRLKLRLCLVGCNGFYKEWNVDWHGIGME